MADAQRQNWTATKYPTGHPAAKVMRRMLRNASGPKRTMRKVEAKRAADKE